MSHHSDQGDNPIFNPSYGALEIDPFFLSRSFQTLISIPTFQDRILISLYKGVKAPENSTRGRRAALLKFSEVCHFIHPNKCRKYISSLLSVIQDIIEKGDEMLQTTLSESMDK